MSTNGRGPGGISGAHTIRLDMIQCNLRVLALPEVDLPALALGAWVVHWHPSDPLGRHDCLAVARDFALLCVSVCLCV